LQEEKSRKKLMHHFSYVIFADDFIAKSLSSEIKQLNINVLPALPLTFCEPLPEKEISWQTTIVIPGTVNQNRNYHLVYKALQNISMQIEKPIELVLLGNASSPFAQNIVKLFERLPTQKIKITSFRHEVSQDIYDGYLRKASFAIIPIKQEFVGGIIREEYGKTKITGTINDVIRFGVPSLLSAFYPKPSELFQAFDSSHQLGNIHKTTTSPKTQESLLLQSKKVCRNFSKETAIKKIQSYFT